jgi:hypothetical protein
MVVSDREARIVMLLAERIATKPSCHQIELEFHTIVDQGEGNVSIACLKFRRSE